MKASVFFFLAVTSVSASADLAVNDVTVRQNRPWSTQTYVDFTLSGLEAGMAKFSFNAYRGDALLGTIPAHTLRGDVFADSNGAKRASFDPQRIDFLKHLGKFGDFRIEVLVAPQSEILYKVVDLRYRPEESEWQTVYVTEEDLRVGSKTVGIPKSSGTVTWTLESAQDPVQGVSSLIWKNIASQTRFLNTHCVMRRVKGGSFVLHKGMTGLERQTSVGDFWICVFSCTRAFFGDVMGWDSSLWNAFYDPVVSFTKDDFSFSFNYRSVRGCACKWPEDGAKVDDGCFIARLRERTGIDSFDLPTEAQWEYACRAGTSTKYYNGSDDEETLSSIAWYSDNATGVQRGGQKAPNAWGLYDMIGNQWEFVLDWQALKNEDVDGGEDPVGPPSAGCTRKIVRGGSYSSGKANCTSFSRTADGSTDPTITTSIGKYYGFRFVQNTGW